MPKNEKDNKKTIVKKEDVKKEEEYPTNRGIPIPREVLEKIPPEARQEIEKVFSITAAGYVGPLPHPFTRKITEEHVTKIIDNIEKDGQRTFQEGRDIRKMSLIIFFAIVIFAGGLAAFFTLLDKTEFVIPFMTGLLGAAGGFGGGYGVAKFRR